MHPEAGVVEGAMHVSVRLPAGARGVRLWLYPDRLRVAPGSMNEINQRWIYPGERDFGGMLVRDVRVNGRPVQPRVRRRPVGTPRGLDETGSELWVPTPSSAARAEVRLRFRLELPRRFGRLGRVGGQSTLAAPWYPLVLGADGAWAFRAPHRVRVDIVGDAEGVIGPVRFRQRGVARTRGPYVPMVVAPRLHVGTQRTAGRTWRYVSSDPPYRPPPPDARGLEALEDVVRVDVTGLVGEQLGAVEETLRATGIAAGEEPLIVVEVPSRTELASTAPGWVLLSDRAYQVLPVEPVRQFHHHRVRRALFRHLVARAGRPDAPKDRPWAEDLRAALLVDLDIARREGDVQSPRELLGWAGFHPTVDQLLYAPQVAFEDVYFGPRAGDGIRDDPRRAHGPVATGRRILEMARDALGAERMARLARRLLGLDVAARDALREVAPDLAHRLPVWLAAPSLEVNYRLGSIESERADRGYRHRIEVVRDGAHRPEPVEVAAFDDDGNRAVGRWEGDTPRGVVEVTTPAPLDEVLLDPRGRLVQSAALAQGHPRGDDATRHPWRPPILQGIYLSGNLSEERFTGSVDFVMRRRYVLDNALGVRLESSPRAAGGLLRYIRDWGPLRHTNDRIGHVAVGVQARRLHEGFTAGGLGGWGARLLLGVGADTRRYFVDPRRGEFGSLSGAVGLVHQDDGDLEPTWTARARAGLVRPFGLRNAVVLVADGAYTGGEALPGELPGLGGPLLLRGYESDEGVGRGRVVGVVEHRWTALSDLALNAAHLAWVREVQLALFAGGGAAFRTFAGERRRWGAEVGAGLRVHFEYGGVQPGVLAIDVGVPLVRDELVRQARSPVAVRVGFDQFY
ncbi:MAG: hypothetical protein ACODAU_04615 [Myxococcota bacterium]